MNELENQSIDELSQTLRSITELIHENKSNRSNDFF